MNPNIVIASSTDPIADRVNSLIDNHREGYSLEQAFYTDKDVFDSEMRAIWHQHWIFAGLACEIREQGAWFKMELGSASAIIMRGIDGQIRAFHNSCRHRGSRICLGEKGRSRNLVCSYHQWTYDSSGKLLHARDMDESFKPLEHSLHPIHVRDLSGYLFISFAENPEPFEQFQATTEPYLLPHHLGNAKVAFESTLIEKTNWKLVVENNRECYHCRVSHPELLRTISEVEDVNDPACSPAFVSKSQADIKRWHTQQLPYALFNKVPGWQIVRVPMSKGLSFTMDGQPASGKLMGELPDFDVGSVRLLHFPSTWNHALGDHAIAFRVIPIDAHTTAVTTKWLVREDAVEGVDYDLANLTKVWMATNEQDRQLAENNQAGINSPAYRPGPFSVKNEYGVMAFIDWYKAALRKGLAAAPAIR